MLPGGEKYFIIGNFNNDANTTLDSNNQINNPNTAGSYYFIDDVSVIDCTVGINEIENLKDKINLMPNPAKDVITISFPLPMFTACHIRIYDIMGKVVYKQDAFIQNQISIPVFNLTNGIYAVELNYEGIKEFKKFVKE
ncbi:MAG: T9SS type A sorting domain-containing protein [Bacteroidia bacterium]